MNNNSIDFSTHHRKSLSNPVIVAIYMTRPAGYDGSQRHRPEFINRRMNHTQSIIDTP